MTQLMRVPTAELRFARRPKSTHVRRSQAEAMTCVEDIFGRHRLLCVSIRFRSLQQACDLPLQDGNGSLRCVHASRVSDLIICGDPPTGQQRAVGENPIRSIGKEQA
ncbi:hypothetical protein ABT294_06545 [Nonomuraea sp. NPDC000554]|uniref:hypothetical protein n=1 Tax=Nonomuraea sp. NPDC000554 TaxID=3154259 RepID=UPI00332F1CE9